MQRVLFTLHLSFWLSLVAPLYATATAATAWAAPALRAEVVTLQHRPPEQLLPELRALYPADQAAFMTDGQRLVIRATPQVVEEIRQLLTVLDVPVAQLRILVRQRGGQQGTQQDLGVGVDRQGVSVSGQRITQSTQRQSQRSLMVQDGQTAEISAGQVRALPLLVQGGDNPAVLYQQAQATSGFLVTPRLISPQQIELQIVAAERHFEGDSARLNAAAVVTQRRVSPGEWVSLGGVEESQQVQRGGLIYQAGTHHQSGQQFEVMVEVMP